MILRNAYSNPLSFSLLLEPTSMPSLEMIAPSIRDLALFFIGQKAD
jgi:hypothetical protein